MKRITAILLLLLAFLTALYFLLLREKNFFRAIAPSYRAIPVDSPAFIEMKSLKKIPLSNPIINEFGKSGLTSDLLKASHQIDSLLKKNQKLKTIIENVKLVIAFCYTGENKIEAVFIIDSETRSKRKAFEKIVRFFFSDSSSVTSTENYLGKKILNNTDIRSSRSIYYSFSSGLFLFSHNVSVVKKSLRQLNQKGLDDDPHFVQVNKTASSGSELSFYIHYSFLPDLLAGSINQDTIVKNNEFGDTLKVNHLKSFYALANFASWSEFDAGFSDEIISLNGITNRNDSARQYISLIQDQPPGLFQVDRILPANTSFFISLNMQNQDSLLVRLKKHSYRKNSSELGKNKLHEGGNEPAQEFEKLFLNTAENEITVAATIIPANPEERITFFIYLTKGAAMAQENYLHWFKKYASANRINLNLLKSDYKINEDLRFTIYNFPYPSGPGILLGKPFTFCEAKFLAFIDDYAVFSNDLQGLKDYLGSISANYTLRKDLSYNKLKQNLSHQSNLTAYLNPGLAYHLSNEYLNQDARKKLDQIKRSVGKIEGIACQMVNSKGLFFSHISLLFNAKGKSEISSASLSFPDSILAANALWQCRLKNRITGVPHAVINHDDKNNREILVQDEENSICQITNDGKLRWRIPLGEKINGKIHQIDFYKNGKLQYLFNTRHKLYLIDRNGNNVKGFPKIFESPSTNGVAVFDYDKNREYRFFIAFEDLSVAGFDRYGEKLRGWNFKATESIVNTPVQHFRIGNKDYIVFRDRSKVYILDRQGSVRVNVSQSFENSGNPIRIYLKGSPKLVFTENNGTVNYIYLTGRVISKNAGRFSSNHFFNCSDLNGDGKLQFIFLDHNALTVMNENGNKIFTRNFTGNIIQEPKIFSISGKLKKIAITDSDEQEIFLFNPDGTLHNGFPMAGCTGFTIDKLSARSPYFDLLVGSSDGSLYRFPLK